jgi:hypothetical protein
MKRIFVPSRSGSDWQPLLEKPRLHWKKGASAMTAAAAWEASSENLPPEITAALDATRHQSLTGLKLLLALPEWEVPLEGGDTSSKTDILALCRNTTGLCVIAVEAKVHEDFGPLIQEKRLEASQGQSRRLAYLENLLHVQRFGDDIRYQLVHRTASALLTAREFHAGGAVMLVHAFDTPPRRRQDFEAFCDALKAKPLCPLVYAVPGFDLPALYLAWCVGDTKYRDVDLPSWLEPVGSGGLRAK